MTKILSNAVLSMGKAVRSVANSVLDWNTSTSSGTVDIIVVRKKTGDGYSYSSTPFHVKFGIFQLMKSSDRAVTIYINDQKMLLKMKLSRNGFAYFVSEEDWDAESVNSNASADEGEDEKFKNGVRPRASLTRSRSADFRDGGSKLKSKKRSKSEKVSKTENEKYSGYIKLSQHEKDQTLRAKQKNDDIRTLFERGKIKLSLCASKFALLKKEKSENKSDAKGFADIINVAEMNRIFKEGEINYEQFLKNPFIVYEEELMTIFQDRIYPVRIFIPYLLGNVVFGKSFDIENFIKTINDTKSNKISKKPTVILEKSKSENRKQLFAKVSVQRNNTTKIKSLTPNVKNGSKQNLQKRILSQSDLIQENNENEISEKLNRIDPQDGRSRSFTPSSDDLASFPLHKGGNVIRFSVESSLQGTQILEAGIYLWEDNEKVVVTDIDGTITKSDVLGFILPNFGNDWAHHDVAKLFRLIEKNGYRVLYLSARLIGLTGITRQYLFGLDQSGGEQLPEGPLLTVPLGLVSAYRRDQFRRPHDMKIQILRDVLKLFGNKNPFYAGFGNKETDQISYKEVGVPNARIFIINPTGNIIKHQLKQSYSSISQNVNQIFPPIDVNHLRYDVKYGMNYWKPASKKLSHLNLKDK